MNEREFEIIVRRTASGAEVKGRHDTPEARNMESGPDLVTITPLQLRTVELLEQWLKRWEWIEQFEQAEVNRHRRKLLVPDTFIVLGSLLWQLVLAGEVGNALEAARRTAEEHEELLRVLINFEDSAQDLATLPWEFLHRPRAGQSPGYFLATETNLVLSRYVRLPDGRPRLRSAQDRIRVLLWLTLPDKPEYAADREACLATLEELRERLDTVADIPQHIDGWQPELVQEQLGTRADIVHVVGVCRGRPDGSQTVVEILQDDENDNWYDSSNLVDTLTRVRTHRPELVVLHLCDWPKSNTTENFERLAPLLVGRGVPAVLAMRYPMEPADADTFLIKFYDKLVEHRDIGVAVQAARSSTDRKAGRWHRRFGAPVLYLESADGRLLGEKPTPPPDIPTVTATAKIPLLTSEISRRPVAAPARWTGATIRQELLTAAHIVEDAENKALLVGWIREQEWPDSRADAAKIVQTQAREWQDHDRLAPAFARMLSSLRESA